MNPFTKFLRGDKGDGDFDRFVAYWDRLEWLTIQVYRAQIDAAEAEEEFARVWPWLRRDYGRWRAALDPYWRQTRAAGEVTQADPFLLLLSLQSPADIEGDWRAMQHLPAAREAINRYLLAQT